VIVLTACGSTLTANGTYITGPGSSNNTNQVSLHSCHFFSSF
jgi:hypothetical protein